MSGIQFANMMNSPINQNQMGESPAQTRNFSEIFKNAQSSSPLQNMRNDSDSSMLQRSVFGDIYGKIDSAMMRMDQANQFRNTQNVPSDVINKMSQVNNQSMPPTSDVMSMQKGLENYVADQAWQLQADPASKTFKRADRKTQSAMTMMAETIEEHGVKLHIDQLLHQLKKTSPMTNSYLMTLANIRHLADKEEFAEIQLKDMNMNPLVNDDGRPIFAQQYLRNRIQELFPNSRFASS